jgi:flagellar biosynthesis protein FlhB
MTFDTFLKALQITFEATVLILFFTIVYVSNQAFRSILKTALLRIKTVLAKLNPVRKINKHLLGDVDGKLNIYISVLKYILVALAFLLIVHSLYSIQKSKETNTENSYSPPHGSESIEYTPGDTTVHNHDQGDAFYPEGGG